jgi:hypothetical protein
MAGRPLFRRVAGYAWPKTDTPPDGDEDWLLLETWRDVDQMLDVIRRCHRHPNASEATPEQAAAHLQLHACWARRAHITQAVHRRQHRSIT